MSTRLLLLAVAILMTANHVHCGAGDRHTAANELVYTIQGAIRLPGPYKWTNGVTLLQAIYTAGGITRPETRYVRVRTGKIAVHRPKDKSQRTIYRFRSGDDHVWVDVTRIGKDVPDPRIKPGCTIHVPTGKPPARNRAKEQGMANNTPEHIPEGRGRPSENAQR